MTLRLCVIGSALLAACADPPAPAGESVMPPLAETVSAVPSASASASVDFGVGVAEPPLPVEPPPVEAAPLAVSASEAERRAAVLDLLAGGAPATRLPIRATDAGKPFDLALRATVSTPGNLPRVRLERSSASPGLPIEVVRRIVRFNFPRIRFCYETALREKPAMAGTIELRFNILPDGAPKGVKASSADIDKAVISCVEKALLALSFPAPEGGRTVSVVYAINFSPS